ncbi:MAG TPA: acyl-CoA dehydrogenase C-terminal domain-containing protein [Gammaproteobacteria bacterium]|nr:acyl-CoA dehydrogenase C-terminal domain-containing protein [Gammaproteobacteria bacterium]
MASYKAPLRDMEFVLNEVVGMERLSGIKRFEEVTPDITSGVLEEAARLIEGSVAPLNEPGDRQGCRLEDGEVTTPDGYREAYRLFVEGGWGSLSHSPEYGGQGLPYVLSQALLEMMASSCMAFSLFPLLTHGACDALEAHGEDALRKLYLPRLVTGEWSGAMCLTEPQAGSDLALVRTRATPRDDGSYRVNGTKIFITAGEHELAGNIIHFVLARLPDAPPGIKGISMFLVPKYLPDDRGAPGERNAMTCTSIEEKMGIHGSPTCEMSYDDAVGYLVGGEHRGIQNMFTMMNAARISVGTQGLGAAEMATQNAVGYARERKQGRAAGTRDGEPVSIIEHPDVRRMLLTMKALTEGGRAVLYDTAVNVDLAHHHPEKSVRERALDHVELFTPICKAFLTDTGFNLASTGIQVFGGHGFIREHGMEQIVRDSKITCLYEGTNGIQAMDLIGRKLNLRDGRLVERLTGPVRELLEAERGNDDLAFITQPLRAALAELESVTEHVRSGAERDPNLPGAAATPYLQICALVALGNMWARAARAALRAEADQAFYRGKLATARFFAAHLLPGVYGLAPAVRSGSRVVTQLDADAF